MLLISYKKKLFCIIKIFCKFIQFSKIIVIFPDDFWFFLEYLFYLMIFLKYLYQKYIESNDQQERKRRCLQPVRE